MRYVMLTLALLPLLQGCLYFNDTGISTRLYSQPNEYYDANGSYHIECNSPKKCNKNNIMEYKKLVPSLCNH